VAFRVMARTLLHLGAELISSDGIAFYELIKNAFDARSPRVKIDVVVALPHDLYVQYAKDVEDSHIAWDARDRNEEEEENEKEREGKAVRASADAIANDLDTDAPNTEALKKRLAKARKWRVLARIVDDANYIDIRDSGSGMSRAELNDVYLTIGTRSRLEDAGQPDDGKPVLGEKGIGRLSVMRLGWQLRIETSKSGEPKWNHLDIDWRRFGHNSTELIENVEVEATSGPPKDDFKSTGTLVHVTALRSRWSAEKLVEIATEEFSRLTDPFTPRSRYPIELRFNGDDVSIPQIDKLLFAQAHATVRAKYETSGKNGPTLIGKIDYDQRHRERLVDLDSTDLAGITHLPVDALTSLGSFEVEFYWFNRGALEAVDGIGDKRMVQKLVNQWSGGLMVFRDGFRVNPYGSHDDDWLDLDKTALASGGYKVNRKQIVGRVEITKARNASLVDQTNREGLKDSDEKTALVRILKNLLESQFRTFLNKVDKELQAREPLKFSDLSNRLEAEEKEVRKVLGELYRKYPKAREDSELVDAIDAAVDRIGTLIEEAQLLADEYQKGRRQLVDLAGLGLMVEIVAHELSRASTHALDTLNETDVGELPHGVKERMRTLRAQLKTLQKRLEILDPLGVAVRQGKQSFELVAWVNNVVESHEGQFARHGIEPIVTVEPHAGAEWQVKMVKGMVVQILENLIANSVYWLTLQKRLEKRFKPRIDIVIDVRNREIRVTDNGPGIPLPRVDEVFQPFVTTKPPGEGKGLGLFISREIAEYHGAQLTLIDEPRIHAKRANTFRLVLSGGQK
jgi:signal transduction histidine kinase